MGQQTIPDPFRPFWTTRVKHCRQMSTNADPCGPMRTRADGRGLGRLLLPEKTAPGPLAQPAQPELAGPARVSLSRSLSLLLSLSLFFSLSISLSWMRHSDPSSRRRCTKDTECQLDSIISTQYQPASVDSKQRKSRVNP